MRRMIFIVLLMLPLLGLASAQLKLIQSIPTHAARGIEIFHIGQTRYLAIAQLAKDVPHTKANMNGGNSDLPTLLYQQAGNQFKLIQEIPGHGNEDVVAFRIGEQHYLAIASIRSGKKPPYDLHTDSVLYQWQGQQFKAIQHFKGYATKGVTSFKIGKQTYLAFANGLQLPGMHKTKDNQSVLYRWDGHQFVPSQYFDTTWAYCLTHFKLDGVDYLAIADHGDASKCYRWDGKQFVLMQTFPERGGRDFEFFQIQGQAFLAFANLTHPSVIFKWNGKQFMPYQTLEGESGRHFEFMHDKNQDYLMLVKFISGTRQAPNPLQTATLYQWQGKQFKTIDTLKTFGGVSAKAFREQNQLYLAVSNSLDSAIRFNGRVNVYQLKQRA